MNPKLNISDLRMLHAFDYVIQSGQERFYRSICEAIGVEDQRIRKVRVGKQHFTAENIRLMAKKYDVNLNYIFGFEDRVFQKKEVNKNVNKASSRKLKLA